MPGAWRRRRLRRSSRDRTRRQRHRLGLVWVPLCLSIDGLLRAPVRRIDGAVEYASDLFDPATVETIVARWVWLLEVAIADPDRPISRIDILTPTERLSITKIGQKCKFDVSSGPLRRRLARNGPHRLRWACALMLRLITRQGWLRERPSPSLQGEQRTNHRRLCPPAANATAPTEHGTTLKGAPGQLGCRVGVNLLAHKPTGRY